MKKAILLITMIFCLFGCAALSGIKTDAMNGYADPEIRQHATQAANTARDVATTAAAAVPIPWLPLAAGGTAWVIAFVTTLIRDEQKHKHQMDVAKLPA